MTGLYEQKPGPGHNLPTEEDDAREHARWERWSKLFLAKGKRNRNGRCRFS